MSETITESITVEIGWSETVSYASRIKVDVAAVREWMRENAEEDDPSAEDAPITNEIIDGYLSDSDEYVWFEQCNTDTDFVSVDERSRDHESAEIITEADAEGS
jgi:hypothetical protein